jgi:hypothetical protein
VQQHGEQLGRRLQQLLLQHGRYGRYRRREHQLLVRHGRHRRGGGELVEQQHVQRSGLVELVEQQQLVEQQ